MDSDPAFLVGGCCQVHSGLLATFQKAELPQFVITLTDACSYLCHQSTLIKLNISESSVRFLLLTVGCVAEEHTDGVSFLNDMFWHQSLSRVFPCFHLALVLERIHERMEKENSVGVLNH